MRQAVISDLHANSDALRAVFDDIEAKGIQEVICLGDIVGYGPEPAECLTMVRDNCNVVLMGNHDYALLTIPFGFNKIAAQAIACHKSILNEGCLDQQRCEAHLEYLKNLPMRHEQNGVVYVHASPRDPLIDYVLESDVAYGPSQKIKEIFELIDGACFVGHSHVPGIVTPDFRWVHPEKANGMDVSDGKFVINEGSVGQPRDRDPRACYAELNDGTVFFHRVEYPFRKTMKKIEEMGCLHSYCAERLALGK